MSLKNFSHIKKFHASFFNYCANLENLENLENLLMIYCEICKVDEEICCVYLINIRAVFQNAVCCQKPSLCLSEMNFQQIDDDCVIR